MKNVELKDFSIGKWNVRLLYRAGHLTTVISSLERYQLNIAAIQETRWPGQLSSNDATMHDPTIIQGKSKKLERR
jgi:hypothetical protein